MSTEVTHHAAAADVAAASRVSCDHMHFSDFELVYEPSEDTFLLSDAVSADAEFVRSRVGRFARIVELGCGSGYVGTAAALAIGAASACVLFVDVNPFACEMALKTAACNGVATADAVQDDMFASCRRGLAGTVDVLLFNPPYVPTDPEEVSTEGLAAAWAGGKLGRQVTDRFLPIAPVSPSPISSAHRG